MKAIQVKYLAATNTQGVRLKAFAKDCMSHIEGRDYSLSIEENAKDVATALLSKLDWNDLEIVGSGSIPNGDFVFTLQQIGKKKTV